MNYSLIFELGNLTLVAALAGKISTRHAECGARMIGISGPQGSGKSTLALALAQVLSAQHGLRVAVLGLDDLYLPSADRLQLAADVHPLLATRGVPGTHDAALGLRLIAALLDGCGGIALPQFDKAADDRASAPVVTDAPVDLLLFEGWCIGARPQSAAALVNPVNALEAREDADGRWRRWINAQLAADYAALFARIDTLVMLRPPTLAASMRWRQQQEAALRAATGRGMTGAQVERFMAHYERLTRALRRSLPQRADFIIDIDRDHHLTKLHTRALRSAA